MTHRFQGLNQTLAVRHCGTPTDCARQLKVTYCGILDTDCWSIAGWPAKLLVSLPDRGGKR
jgi:hypothetical protein